MLVNLSLNALTKNGVLVVFGQCNLMMMRISVPVDPGFYFPSYFVTVLLVVEFSTMSFL